MVVQWTADVLFKLEIAAHCWTDAVFVSKDRWDSDDTVVDNNVHCWTDAVFVSKDRWDSADVSVSQHASADDERF